MCDRGAEHARHSCRYRQRRCTVKGSGRNSSNDRHNTFASGGSDGIVSIWNHQTKKRMKLYPKYPTSISAMAFSPDGRRLAIACSYEHDNALLNGSPEDQGKVMLLIKETVNEDCKVRRFFPLAYSPQIKGRASR